MPADELHLREVALECSRPIHISPRSPGYAEESCRTAQKTGGAAIGFPRHPVILVSHSHIQSNAGLQFEVILNEPAKFALAPRSLLRFTSQEPWGRTRRGIERL